MHTFCGVFLLRVLSLCSSFFFFNDTATTEIYTLSLHDALPISKPPCSASSRASTRPPAAGSISAAAPWTSHHEPTCPRSEEHTSELQSLAYLVCRLLLEKKKNNERHRTIRKNRHRASHRDDTQV